MLGHVGGGGGPREQATHKRDYARNQVEILLAQQRIASSLSLLDSDGYCPVKISRSTVGDAGLGGVQRSCCRGGRHLNTSEGIGGHKGAGQIGARYCGKFLLRCRRQRAPMPWGKQDFDLVARIWLYEQYMAGAVRWSESERRPLHTSFQEK